jgi:hypothetical protein
MLDRNFLMRKGSMTGFVSEGNIMVTADRRSFDGVKTRRSPGPVPVSITHAIRHQQR